MLRRSIAILTVVSVIMLGILLATTTPSTAGPLGILGFFIFMYLTALGVLTFLFHGLSLIASKVPLIKQRRFSVGEISLKSAYYYASVIASVPVMFVAMQSVGQIGAYQVLLISFFVVVAWVYVTNRAV